MGPAVFVTAWAVLGARMPDYDPTTDAISRLAAAGAPYQAGMTAGFVAFGVGVPLFAGALRDALPGRAWMTAAATGIATLGVAALPLDGWAGDPAHAVAAGVGYVTLAATPLLAAGPLADLGHRRAAVASRIIGVAALACLAGTTVAERSGLLQRMGLTLGDIWLVAAAVGILRGGYRHPTRATPPPGTGPAAVIAWVPLPFQIPLVLWALSHRRRVTPALPA